MKLRILYRPKTDQEGLAIDYAKDFERRFTGKKAELVDLDTVEGDRIAQLYDAVRYPAILVTSEDGSLMKMWQDRPLPALDEVNSYLQ